MPMCLNVVTRHTTPGAQVSDVMWFVIVLHFYVHIIIIL